MSQKVRVGVVGYGVIGKRVADAVALQEDMELVGVLDVVPNDMVRVAFERGYPIFLGTPDAEAAFAAAGIPTAGQLVDLVKQADLIVDCAPPPLPARNIPVYEEHDVKYIVQGGEKHGLTNFSFSSFANYGDAVGKSAARVVSCNTTSESRLLSTLHRAFGVKSAFIAITRRGVDPVNVNGGPVNAIVATLPGFSHHAPDVQTVIPGLEIRSMAVVASTTLMHVHTVRAELNSKTDADSVRSLLAKTPRFRLVSGAGGTTSTAHILEWARDHSRPRNDHWEVAVWEDSIVVDDDTLYLLMAVHMESVVVPETIDCIRAMCGVENSAALGIRMTDLSLGMAHPAGEYDVLNAVVTGS